MKDSLRRKSISSEKEERNAIPDYRNQAERPAERTQHLTVCFECNGSGKTQIYTPSKTYESDCEKCNGLG